MDSSFEGFGPITKSNTTHFGGFGHGASFVPLQGSYISNLPPTKQADKIQIYSYSGTDGEMFTVQTDYNLKLTKAVFGNFNNTENIEIKCDSNTATKSSSIYGFSHTAAEYFLIKCNATDTQFYIQDNTTNYVQINIPQDNLGNHVSAYWQEIDICVSGTMKKMKVLGTLPY